MTVYTSSEETPIEIFTDGACLGNPGPGGYGVIIRIGKKETSLSAGYRLTTNNRMELLAAIVGLDHLPRFAKHVYLFTDSQYLVKGMTNWLPQWKRSGFRSASKQSIKNPDLWRMLDRYNQQFQVTWHWIKGHSGHPENQRCDALARAAAQQTSLLEDVGYV